MPFLEENVNTYGTPVSVFVCDTCGDLYTVCPVVPDVIRSEWVHCLAERCPSYEVARDADLYFLLDQVGRGPIPEGTNE